jgi:outer membrane protein assembly factor BamA
MRRVWDRIRPWPSSSLGVLGLLGMLGGGMAAADDIKPPDPGGNTPDPAAASTIKPSDGWLQRWLNPKSAPFIPVPEIATDPDSGTTLGLLAVYLKTDDNNEISQIIAPDFLHNPNFGFGTHARIYSFSSSDEQWSLVAGIKERVEREFDAEYQIGRSRLERWSLSFSAIYDRDGTPRFYGIGNRTHEGDETSFTNNQELVQANIGFNITHEWQILYTARLQVVDVQPGTIDDVPSIGVKFPTVNGLNTNKLMRNRLSVVYDSRDDLTVPTRGMELVAYGGVASSNGLFNTSIYSETGVDARGYWPVFSKTILAAHSALRYLPAFNDVPFWAQSSVGGGQSDVGGQQALRGFGTGRFYGRNSFATTVELRQTVMSFNAAGTSVELEVSPFVDVARVFGRTDTFPLGSLHQVYGVGFRGIARPFVVGHVDLGYGSEGLAVFTGLNYPF